MTEDTNKIRGEYFDKDYDEVKIRPANIESEDDSDEGMAEKFGY